MDAQLILILSTAMSKTCDGPAKEAAYACYAGAIAGIYERSFIGGLRAAYAGRKRGMPFLSCASQAYHHLGKRAVAAAKGSGEGLGDDGGASFLASLSAQSPLPSCLEEYVASLPSEVQHRIAKRVQETRCMRSEIGSLLGL